MRASHASIVAVAVLLGAVLGLGTYTFTDARGWAYLTDDAGACANCHVMHEQYDGWIKSSHRSLAVSLGQTKSPRRSDHQRGVTETGAPWFWIGAQVFFVRDADVARFRDREPIE
jgi:nitrate/TMAO reductase-like tetraheme cytochrome c subunit